MEVIRQDSFSIIRFANSFKNSNTFIIAPDCCDRVWLVDVGDSGKALSAIGDKRIEGIFLTHAHLDHIYGIKDVLNKFPECVVYGSDLCLEYLLDDRKNLSFYYECPLAINAFTCQKLTDNSTTRLGWNLVVKCFHTPGHTPDSVCYVIGNAIFTGDAYIPGIPTVTKLRGGNKILAGRSIELIQSKIARSTMILPGHGNVTRNFE